jgi:menaquinone-9 beta-reductase
MLARRGLRVCLLDKSRFPSETLSTHVIQPCGVGVLDRIGILDGILAAGAVPLTRFTFVNDGARMEARLDEGLFDSPSLSMRRVTLDQLLVDGAVSAGVEVRTGTRATGLLREEGRVVGVETGDGALRAGLVVGADGRGSTVARLVGAREYHLAPPGRVFAWAYFEGVAEPEAHLRLAKLGDLTYVAAPTDAGLHLAAACPAMDARDSFLADREGSYMAALGAWPELAGLLVGARRSGPIRVLANWQGYFREPTGPGWVLLGDAGNFKDPSPAQGIADALRQAERLVDAVAAGLAGDCLDAELRRWGRWRDEDGYEMHWLATDMGAAGATFPLAAQVLHDIAAGEEDTRRFLRMLNHEIRPSRLFTPRRIAVAAARVVLRYPRQVPEMVKEAVRELNKEVGRAVRARRQGGATERLLLALTLIGFVVPNVFVAIALFGESLGIGEYFSLWTASVPSTQLLLDLAIAALAFLVWAAAEARRTPIARWWLCIPATFLVGLCFSLPLFLWMRERELWKHAPRP